MTTFICGNSHTGALQSALQAEGAGGHEITIFPFGSGQYETQPFSALADGRVALTQPEYAQNLARYAGAPYFDPAHRWGLCLGTHNARIYRAPLWRSAAPAAVARPGQRPIPEAMLDAMILEDQRYICAFILQMREAGQDLFVVSAPPPRQDHACIRSGTPRAVVGAIDARARGLFAEWLASLGVAFVDVPPEARTEDGFLEERFAQKTLPSGRPDPHHANRDYGARMMRRIGGWLDPRSARLTA